MWRMNSAFIRRVAIAALMLTIAGLSASGVAGQQRPLTITASDPLQAPLNELKPQLERAAGTTIAFHFGTSPTLQREIEGGAAFDVAILPPAATTALRASGHIGAPVALGQVGIGVGVRARTPHPDIRTVDAFKRTLASAASITYVREGASRMGIEQLIEKLGLTAQMQPKTHLLAGYEEMAASVSSGESALVLIPMSEIPLMRGVEVVGPLPKDIQSVVVFQGAASASSSNAAAAGAVLRALTSDAARATFRKNGFETP